jgi:type IV pilus assembly protein PilA
VTEGLSLADGWKTAIAEYYANTGNWPTQTNLSGTQPSVGKYESGVTVTTGGVIQITYGGQANAKLNNLVLRIVPYTNTNNDVLWQCGTATAPSAGTIASSASSSGTTVSPQYLPTSCHS